MAKINFVLLVLLHLQVLANANYLLIVNVLSYDNPTNRCEECGTSGMTQTCCDDRTLGDCTGTDRCDNMFFYCLRPLGSLNVETNPFNCGPMFTSEVNEDAAPIDFDQPQVLGLSNPLTLVGPTVAWQGIQLYIEVEDDDGNSGADNTVDAFLIDIPFDSVQVGQRSPVLDRDGIYGWATISLQYQVMCGEGYIGPACDQQDPCFEVDCGRGACSVVGDSYNCECEAGFAGERCEMVDRCEQASCDHGVCVNTVDNFTCECEAGFAGERCEMDDDSCAQAWCGDHGACVNTVDNFRCECEVGFAGRLCQTDIDDCENFTCSGHGLCVDQINSHSCVCDIGYGGAECERLVVPVAAVLGVIGAVVVFVAIGLVCVFVWRYLKIKRRGSKSLESEASSNEEQKTAHVEQEMEPAAVPGATMLSKYRAYSSPLHSIGPTPPSLHPHTNGHMDNELMNSHSFSSHKQTRSALKPLTGKLSQISPETTSRQLSTEKEAGRPEKLSPSPSPTKKRPEWLSPSPSPTKKMASPSPSPTKKMASPSPSPTKKRPSPSPIPATRRLEQSVPTKKQPSPTKTRFEQSEKITPHTSQGMRAAQRTRSVPMVPSEQILRPNIPTVFTKNIAYACLAQTNTQSTEEEEEEVSSGYITLVGGPEYTCLQSTEGEKRHDTASGYTKLVKSTSGPVSEYTSLQSTEGEVESHDASTTAHGYINLMQSTKLHSGTEYTRLQNTERELEEARHETPSGYTKLVKSTSGTETVYTSPQSTEGDLAGAHNVSKTATGYTNLVKSTSGMETVYTSPQNTEGDLVGAHNVSKTATGYTNLVKSTKQDGNEYTSLQITEGEGESHDVSKTASRYTNLMKSTSVTDTEYTSLQITDEDDPHQYDYISPSDRSGRFSP